MTKKTTDDKRDAAGLAAMLDRLRTAGEPDAAELLEYLQDHHDDCHQPAANYELLLARLDGEPTNHGHCRVAAELDRLQGERDAYATELTDAEAKCKRLAGELVQAQAAGAVVQSLIARRYSYDVSMREDGCDVIGNSMLPLETEERLLIVRILRDAGKVPGGIPDSKPIGQPLLDELAQAREMIGTLLGLLPTAWPCAAKPPSPPNPAAK